MAQAVKTGKLKGWVVIPRENIHQVYTKFKPRVDSLTEAGYQLHYFNTGFAIADTAKFKTLSDSVALRPVKNWVLLKELSNQIPAGLPVYLFTANSLNSVTGAKPQLNLNLHVKTYSPTDSTAKWIQNAALTNRGIKITEGNSQPNGTIFSSTTVQATEQRSSTYQVNINNGRPSVSYKDDTIHKAVAVDTSTVRIAIYGDKGSDAQYVKAALEAVKQFTSRKMDIQVSNTEARIRGSVDWVFWLRERRVPLTIAENVSHVLVYEPGKIQNINTWLDIDNYKIGLTKHIVTVSNGETVWKDGFGDPVLSLESGPVQQLYHFYSRFNPSWGDLVWSDAFPKLMLNLLTDAPSGNIRDKRRVDDKQLLPLLTTDKTIVLKSQTINKTDLSKAFWLALVLLFLIERLFAHRTKSTENYG